MNQLQDSNQDRNRRRRARNDPNNRDYICPCGKSYLSYPALFTHVKQKHNGKAPGVLIKPKNQNVKRGRPRGGSINLREDEQIQSIEQNILDKLQTLLEKQEIDHEWRFNYPTAGKNNCNQIFKEFLQQINYFEESSKKILEGFICLLKKAIEQSMNEEYCEKQDARQIIQVANQLITETRQTYENQFPISEQLLIKITKNFFQWLYRNKFTDHILKQN